MSRLDFRQIVICGAIFLIAFWFRFQYVTNTQISNPVSADARQYINYAINLSEHSVFSIQSPSDDPPVPDSFRSPGYPFFISLLISNITSEHVYKYLIISQVILGALVAVLCYYLGTLFLPKVLSLAASVLTIVSPHLLSMSSYILTETLFSFLLIIFLIFIIHLIRKNTFANLFLTSVFFGAATLTNETLLLFPLFLILVMFLVSGFRREEKLAVQPRLLLVFLVALIVIPTCWQVRNSMIDQPEQYSGKTRALATMSHGMYPDFFYKTEKFRNFPYREDPEYKKIHQDPKLFFQVILDRASEEPLRYLRWYAIGKPISLWSWDIKQGQGDVYIYAVKKSWYDVSFIAYFSKTIMKLIHSPLVIVSIIGIVMLIIRARLNKCDESDAIAMILASLLIYYTLLFMVFAPWPRYSIPLRPELYLLSMWSIQKLFSYCRISLGEGV